MFECETGSAHAISLLRTASFDEYVAHSGRIRIAFDDDGADLDDFNANILLDVEDPVGGVGNSGQGSIWQFEVTLPNQTCTNCTLQLIQMMNGNTTDPVLDPIGKSSYYACADLILGDGGGGGDPPDAGDGGGGGGGGQTNGGCQVADGSAAAGGLSAILTVGLLIGFAIRRKRCGKPYFSSTTPSLDTRALRR